MAVKCCAACGQTLPRALPEFGIPLVGNKLLLMRRIHRAGKHGVDAETLLRHLCAGVGEPPLTGYKIISVYVWHLNRELKKHGRKIVSDSPKGGAARGGSGIIGWQKHEDHHPRLRDFFLG